MLCFRCGYNNSLSESRIVFCHKCNVRLLTKEEKPYTVKEEPKLDRLNKIITMANEFLEGKCSSEEFSEFLEKQLKSMEKFEETLKVLGIPEELYKEFAPQIDSSIKGINLYKEAIKILKSAAEGKEEEKNIKVLLEEGIKIAKEGNKEINKSYRMSEIKLKEVREDTPRYIENEKNYLF